jgi:hypothetical protein
LLGLRGERESARACGRGDQVASRATCRSHLFPRDILQLSQGQTPAPLRQARGLRGIKPPLSARVDGPFRQTQRPVFELRMP